jgi:hypothetical protein
VIRTGFQLWLIRCLRLGSAELRGNGSEAY